MTDDETQIEMNRVKSGVQYKLITTKGVRGNAFCMSSGWAVLQPYADGDPDAIGRALLASVPAGFRTYGSRTCTALDSEGVAQRYAYSPIQD